MLSGRSRSFAAALSALALGACGANAEEDGAWAPDQWCPGDPGGGCDTLPGTALLAGTGVRSVIPACFETWSDLDGDATVGNDEPFNDCGCDQLCPGDAGYPGPDAGEGDGELQAAWMGGFHNGRAANGVRGAALGLRGDGDGLWARAIVLTQGNTTVALVAIDALGIMIDQTQQIRDAVAAAGHDVDLVVVQSSHVHEAPDTMGIYGPGITKTGFNADYAQQIADAVAEAVGDVLDAQVEVELSVGTVDAGDYWENGIANLIRDTRDPVVVDPRIGAAHFVGPDGATVATLVHWANHPETVADQNTLLTSDFAHALRETVEDGVQWGADPARPGLGGTALFFNGAVGGMMTSLGAEVLDPTGVVWSEASFEKADAVGQLVGEMALDAVAQAEPAAVPDLWFRRATLELPVQNIAFQAMFILGVLDHRQVYDYDPEEPIDEDNEPFVHTEVDLIGIGPLTLLTIPGELLPELAIGGYDGSFTPPGADIVDPNNPNPPDLSAAPQGPYLLERVGGGYDVWILGLGNDELGYIIPPYDFVVSEAAYLSEAEGDHYEETNSLGPQTATLIEAVVDQLVAWSAL